MTRNLSGQPARHEPASAEEWLARLLSPESGADDRAGFERWRAADPQHAAAYAAAERIHRRAAELAGDPLLRAAARAARRAPQRSHRRAWLLAGGMAACLLLAAVLLWPAREQADLVQRYAQAAGLPQNVLLPDGTALALDAESALTIRFGAHRREVVLERGRAEFGVAHDPARPFVVRVGEASIHDVGTVFQVSRDDAGATVGLLQGRVDVSGGRSGDRWSSTLAPAQQLRIGADGRPGAVAPLDLAAARGWTQGELRFRGRRLDQLLAEMNRYSDTKLRLGDPALAALTVSGSFHAGDQQALATALARGWQLQVRRTAERELTLLPRPGATYR
ncbi:FecR family protein [Fulvimonas soli]|jgi:transmembrane sensor|uniref:FecR family protein n=1 Tax=Fulvimonas soli TaxID=155197 RepID=A0A316HN15_9GAMM|nr:FecR domain-containing protein [Fulvimonas soli]PWK81546.1 FecR family protein [Fulvimonas soli]TNY26728.1 hypothetical protein BV497_07130 [Fulvimonas soli]